MSDDDTQTQHLRSLKVFKAQQVSFNSDQGGYLALAAAIA